MVQIVAVDPERPSYEKLKERNARLAERLRETRKLKEKNALLEERLQETQRSNDRMMSWMLAWAMLFGVAGTLLALTWGGLIVV